MQLVIASNNEGKIREIRPLLQDMDLLSLQDIGYTAEIPEPYFTFEENAWAKATTIAQFSGRNAFADDSGLCIDALGGAPGVISAHYSGTRDDEQNLQKVLAELSGATNRAAHYKAVICLVWAGDIHYFEGVCKGQITVQKNGTDGFGYDPIFVPDGYDTTFGSLPLVIKNCISHRAIAIGKMVDFLKNNNL